MSKKPNISKSFWDGRTNLNNKPSLSYRTIEVIQHLMNEEEIALGIAIEKLMINPSLYREMHISENLVP